MSGAGRIRDRLAAVEPDSPPWGGAAVPVAPGARTTQLRPEVAMKVHVPAGVATGVGSLPHRDAAAAAEFVLEQLPALPSIPSLPRRSPAERILAHGLVGVRGAVIDDDGEVRLDVDRLDPLATIHLDIDHDAFGGLRAFLVAAAGRRGAGEVAGGRPRHPGAGAGAARRAGRARVRRGHPGGAGAPAHRAPLGRGRRCRAARRSW